MGKNEGIRVTVRFRPMNKREQEEGSQVCVKISSCGRACEVSNPNVSQQTKRPYFFDTIYGPGSNQMEVYEYSGKPLVEAMKQGYNSTIFAYGQTGSGKTWSMMGALGTENRGLQPRIIENVFDHIENMPEGCTDEFTVQISMCEIYMERIKDLFNPIQDDLKVRENAKEGIHVAGLTEQYCASAQEVLDAMEAGAMSRATSKTSMNNESSRSHCVTILKVTKRSENGTKTVSKIKMVDLAGSEKTKKTDAVGQRLAEAKMINQSLTALSQVLNALCKGGAAAGHHVPYRNSKLTRILEDALGGNSKTSLIVAASPVSFNVEETISSLRFGERAKKVKCNAVINQELSIEEYKKQLKKLQKEVEALEGENQLLKARELALFQFLNGKGYDAEAVVKDVRVGEEEEKQLDASSMSFAEVSGEAFVINKLTGKVECGNQPMSRLGAKARNRQAAAEKKMQEAAENERIATIAAQLIRRGDYKGLASVLEGKVALGGGASSQAVNDMEDQIADLKAELRGADNLNDQLDDELESVLDKNDQMLHDIEALKARLAEHRFYKQKVEFLEKESEMQYRRLKDQEHMIPYDANTTSEIDLAFLGELPSHLQDKVQQLANTISRKDAMIGRLRENASVGFNSEEIVDMLKNGEQAQAVRKILDVNKRQLAKLRESEQTAEKAKRQAAMLIKRDAYNKQLQTNWKTQLRQMEQAILLCSTIHKRDRTNYGAQLKAKDEQILKLKIYLEKMSARSKPAPKTILGAGGKVIRKPVLRKTMMKKKRRPSKVVHSNTEQAVTQSRA